MKERAIRAARALGLEVDVRTLAASTHTVSDAAAAVGCDASQIAKTIVFVADGEPVMVVASGAHRIDAERLCLALDCAELRQASEAEVRAATGYPLGGVAPFGCSLPVVVDETLLSHERVYAAGGDGNTLFALDPRELARTLEARVLAVA